jgi:hypothetical protein
MAFGAIGIGVSRLERSQWQTRLEELRPENEWLRDLAVSLSVTLLRNMALDPPRYRRNISSDDAELLLNEAEKCFRCAKVPGLEVEIAQGLEAAGHELMARAVEIETLVQRKKKWKQ